MGFLIELDVQCEAESVRNSWPSSPSLWGRPYPKRHLLSSWHVTLLVTLLTYHRYVFFLLFNNSYPSVFRVEHGCSVQSRSRPDVLTVLLPIHIHNESLWHLVQGLVCTCKVSSVLPLIHNLNSMSKPYNKNSLMFWCLGTWTIATDLTSQIKIEGNILHVQNYSWNQMFGYIKLLTIVFCWWFGEKTSNICFYFSHLDNSLSL